MTELLHSRQLTRSNRELSFTLTPGGKLTRLENRIAEEQYQFSSDEFAIETDRGVFSNHDREADHIKERPDGFTFHFGFGNDRIELRYTLGSGNNFFRRTLNLSNAEPLRLLRIRFGRSEWVAPAEDVVHYLTFWMTPTVEFIRFRAGGCFTGIENPFYRPELERSGVALDYAPGLILAAHEGYESEAQFIGIYRKSGIMLEDSGRPFRFPNASGHIPIDRNESRAMRRFALDYLHPEQDRFLVVNYQFFHPLPQMPRDAAEAEYYLKASDTLAAIGGDMVIFNPLHPYTRPDQERDGWNLLPSDPDAPACAIVRHAEAKGLGIGFYMGCAVYGTEGNAGGLPFRPDRPEWKKLDADGRRAPDNCLGCDDFFDWWLHVQNATIREYHLSNWSWDPSRGSAMNCHDESHGHIAGMGAYKGWRRCMELGRRLKEAHPRLFIQAFYGTKQFGPWGLGAVDGHEVYNEQTALVCTHHTQISDDRQNADGLRFQNYWSMRFRFLPTVIGHPLVGRMSERYFNPDQTKACDYYGWRYAFFSALAVSGTIMPAILPYTPELLPGYREFHQKWISWAKRYFDYVPYTEPFGGQVQPGTIDGYARIRNAHGFVFLFNGNPRPARITFEVGDEINLQTPGDYEFRELYPAENSGIVADCAGESVFGYGRTATLEVPANDCRVLELRSTETGTPPQLLGDSGTLTRNGDALTVSGLLGRPGETAIVRIRHAAPAQVTRLTVNGRAVPFEPTGEGICAAVAFAGERHLRSLDNWMRPDGTRFAIPNPTPEPATRIEAAFHLSADLPELLCRATPSNAAEMDAQIADWQRSEEFDCSYHNFVCCRPQRLWLILPFLTAPDTAPDVEVNGIDRSGELRRDRNGNAFYLDLTDLAQYGATNRIALSLPELSTHDFMGPFLLYPEEARTTELTDRPTETAGAEPVVYSNDLTVPLPVRYARENAPVILEAVAEGKVTLTRPTRLRVRVNLPSERLQAVKFTESGFPWMGIGELHYDATSQCWTAKLTPGPRERIQESEYVYVWAIDDAGRYSDYRPVRIEWNFLP